MAPMTPGISIQLRTNWLTLLPRGRILGERSETTAAAAAA